MTTEKDDMDAAINIRTQYMRRLDEKRSPSERLGRVRQAPAGIFPLAA